MKVKKYVRFDQFNYDRDTNSSIIHYILYNIIVDRLKNINMRRMAKLFSGLPVICRIINKTG